MEEEGDSDGKRGRVSKIVGIGQAKALGRGGRLRGWGEIGGH